MASSESRDWSSFKDSEGRAENVTETVTLVKDQVSHWQLQRMRIQPHLISLVQKTTFLSPPPFALETPPLSLFRFHSLTPQPHHPALMCATYNLDDAILKRLLDNGYGRARSSKDHRLDGSLPGKSTASRDCWTTRRRIT